MTFLSLPAGVFGGVSIQKKTEWKNDIFLKIIKPIGLLIIIYRCLGQYPFLVVLITFRVLEKKTFFSFLVEIDVNVIRKPELMHIDDFNSLYGLVSK